MYTQFSENLRVDGKIILEWIVGRKVWTGCISIRIGTNGGLL